MMRTCRRETNRRFAIDFATYDKKRGTGGRLVQLSKCYMIGTSHDEGEHHTFTVMSELKDNPSTVHKGLVLRLNGQPVTI